MGKSYINLKKLKEKDGEISFEAELAADSIAESEEEVLAEAGQDIAVPGFRKGKVPPAMVRERMDPMGLLEEAAHKALPEAIREILEDEKLFRFGTAGGCHYKTCTRQFRRLYGSLCAHAGNWIAEL